MFKVDGVRAVEMHAVANRSRLLKPKAFDTSKYAAKWAFVGADAEAAQLQQPLVPGYMADGWAIWKDDDDKPCIRPLGGKQVILMCRPKVLQKAINGIFGNISKERTIAEQQGKTVEGRPVPRGLLPGGGKKLAGYDPASDAESEPIPYRFNQIPTIRGATGTAEVRSKSAGRRRTKAAA